MSKLDPNLLLLLVAGAGGLIWFTKFGGREMLEGMMNKTPTTTADPEAEVAPDPKAQKEEAVTPEPSRPDAEEEWDDGKGNTYIIVVDGWMWVNNRRMYPPDHPDWERYYRMRKYHWRYRRCMAKYRNHRWCKDKERFCSGAWRNTPWCRGFKRGDGHHHHPPPPSPKPPRTPPHSPPSPPPSDTNNCPPFIYKNGRKYRFTRDPMPDVMPAIFPPPYIKEGNCVYKLDNNQGGGQDGRSGWDGDRGGSSGGNWWDRLTDSINDTIGTSFYTYNRIGNV